MLSIVTPRSPEELDAVRALMRDFVAWHRQRHADVLHLVDGYFDPAAFDAELAGLPGAYGPPGGQLRLALLDGQPAGCVAYRRVDEHACEMKRMFVRPAQQRTGAGRALATALLSDARAAGYRRMVLDTGIRQAEAIALYRSLGFADRPAPEGTPEVWREALVFMEREL